MQNSIELTQRIHMDPFRTIHLEKQTESQNLVFTICNTHVSMWSCMSDACGVLASSHRTCSAPAREPPYERGSSLLMFRHRKQHFTVLESGSTVET